MTMTPAAWMCPQCRRSASLSSVHFTGGRCFYCDRVNGIARVPLFLDAATELEALRDHVTALQRELRDAQTELAAKKQELAKARAASATRGTSNDVPLPSEKPCPHLSKTFNHDLQSHMCDDCGEEL